MVDPRDASTPAARDAARPAPADDAAPAIAEARADPAWTGVDAWVFDLDNTLYPSEADLFAQVDARMTTFVARALGVDTREARRLQKLYYAEHGTTLNGLMTRHGLAPDAFLDFVHDIDLSPLSPCAVLRARIAALPGRKFIFTNGSRGHADRVAGARGLEGLFDGVFDIQAAGFTPKPHADAYHRFLDAFDVDPSRAAMFEDLPRNLEAPFALGFRTVLVHSDKDWSHEPAGARPAGPDDAHDHVHFVTGDLTAFLGSILGELGDDNAGQT